MRVMVSIPQLPPYEHKHVSMAVDRLRLDARHDLRVIRPSHRPYENTLHHTLNDFMDGGEDYWLNIDADNPPLRNPLDLIDLDLDVVGCPTPVWHWTGQEGERPIYWNAYRSVPEKGAYTEWQPRDGLQCVDAIGTGCFLVNRRVFEHPEMRKAPFQRTYNEDGTVDKGNDIAFSERARAHGFKIWAHFDYPCRHFHEVDLHEVAQAISGMTG